MIARVQAFQTTDGSLFESEAEAVAHDRAAALKEAITEFWRRHGDRVFDHDGDVLSCGEFLENLPEFMAIMKRLAQEGES